MLDKFDARNFCDDNGNPTGGAAEGTGMFIRWQQGPLGRGAERLPPNGAFAETVIAAVKQRLEFFQTASDGKFACIENAQAIFALDQALTALNNRTKAREEREVEGTHQP